MSRRKMNHGSGNLIILFLKTNHCYNMLDNFFRRE